MSRSFFLYFRESRYAVWTRAWCLSFHQWFYVQRSSISSVRYIYSVSIYDTVFPSLLLILCVSNHKYKYMYIYNKFMALWGHLYTITCMIINYYCTFLQTRRCITHWLNIYIIKILSKNENLSSFRETTYYDWFSQWYIIIIHVFIREIQRWFTNILKIAPYRSNWCLAQKFKNSSLFYTWCVQIWKKKDYGFSRNDSVSILLWNWPPGVNLVASQRHLNHYNNCLSEFYLRRL